MIQVIIPTERYMELMQTGKIGRAEDQMRHQVCSSVRDGVQFYYVRCNTQQEAVEWKLTWL